MDRPDLTVSNLMDNAIEIKRVKDPTFTCFIHVCIGWYLSHMRKCPLNAHANVSKVRYSMGYFDSENPDKMSHIGISSESALFSMQR